MTSPQPSEGLTIGDLAARTGVAAATLRSWEERFGFPTPGRSAGGQRRYSDADVELVRRTVLERERGLGLAAAIAAVGREQRVGEGSLFAALRAAHPHLDVIALSVKAMLALTWAIEDECLAHASRPLVLGCFQDQPSFARAGTRWRRLARSARRAVVLSDFEATDSSAVPQRVAVPPDSPLLGEWSLICDDPHLSVALVGWERPRSSPHAARRFEAVLTMEPEVVRDAVARYAAMAQASGLADASRLTEDLARSAGDTSGRPMSLLRRFAVYSDA